MTTTVRFFEALCPGCDQELYARIHPGSERVAGTTDEGESLTRVDTQCRRCGKTWVEVILTSEIQERTL